MSTIHPKLNWRQFQIDRAKKRKKRLMIWWLVGAVSSIAAFAVWSLFSPFAQETPNPTSIPAPIQQRTKLPINNSSIPQSIAVKPKIDPLKQGMHNTFEHASRSRNGLASMTNHIYDNPVHLGVKKLKVIDGVEHEINQTCCRGLISAIGSTIELTPFKQKKKMNIHNSYIPWTSERFISDEFSNYRALNSIEIQTSIPISDDSKLKIDFVPAFAHHRFQLQYFDSYADKKYLPGSIVGYTRNVDSIIPVYGDTVYGVTSRTLRKNGSIQEIVLPLNLSSSLYKSQNLYVDAYINSGVVIRMSSNGMWSDSGELYSIENGQKIGLQLTGGVNLGYQMDSFTIGLGYSLAYQTNTLKNMRSIYHYPRISLKCDL
jgi:hypothetical protein